MKLRLRSVETKETVRIEVPSPCTLQQLKEILTQIIGSSSSESLNLSLNRKEELLCSSPDDTLQSVGVISGDLIFFSLNPNSFSSQSPTFQSAATSQQPQNSRETTTLIPNSQIVQNLESESVGSETKNPIFNTQKEALNSSTQKGENLNLDTKLGESVEYMEVEDDGSFNDIGKSFSVPGFLRKVFIKELGADGGNHHKLLVIAIHAVLLESGFVGFDPVSNLMISGFHFPEKWPSSAFKMSLWYTLPEIIDGVYTVVLKFQNLGKFFNVYGSLSDGSGTQTHWVRVNEDELVPFLNVIWANCSSNTRANGIDGISSSSPEREVFTFWRTVKDRLALPLLIDLCEKANLDLPPCFIRLPTELKLKILECLPGVDIAKVGSVCSELLYLTSNDDLWKQKFVEQFGDAELSGKGSHWKEKFAKALESRKRRMPAPRRILFPTRRDRHPFPPPIIGGDHDFLPPLGFNMPLFRQPDRSRFIMHHFNLGGLGS